MLNHLRDSIPIFITHLSILRSFYFGTQSLALYIFSIIIYKKNNQCRGGYEHG